MASIALDEKADEVRIRMLDVIEEHLSRSTSINDVKVLAEALAWAAAPSQPHG